MERKVINRKHFSFWPLKNRTFSVLSPKACPYVIMPPIVADINHRTCHAKGIRVSIYLPYWIIGFLKIGFSPKASGFYPFGDATDPLGRAALVMWCG